MTSIKLLLAYVFCLVTVIQCSAQNWGLFVHPATESFYTKNLSVSVGVTYKEIRVGYYHQSAYSDDIGRFVRKGILAEVGLANIDEICYFSVGVRVVNTNSQFVSVIPHGVIAWRIKPYIEIPIVLSTYSNWLTGSIGVRVIFKK